MQKALLLSGKQALYGVKSIALAVQDHSFRALKAVSWLSKSTAMARQQVVNSVYKAGR